MTSRPAILLSSIIISLMIISGFIYYELDKEPPAKKSNTGTNSSPAIPVNYSNFEPVMSKNSMVKEIPAEDPIMLKFYSFSSGSRKWEKSFILSSEGVVEGTVENPELTITSQTQQLILTVDNVNDHIMQVSSITSNQITFTLIGEETTLSLGESKVFTLDGENIQITLNSIVSGNANLTFKKLAVEAPIIEETSAYLKAIIWIGLIAAATVTTLFLVRRRGVEPPFQKARERVEEIRKMGYKDDQIRDMFRKKGWPEQAIDKIFKK